MVQYHYFAGFSLHSSPHGGIMWSCDPLKVFLFKMDLVEHEAWCFMKQQTVRLIYHYSHQYQLQPLSRQVINVVIQYLSMGAPIWNTNLIFSSSGWCSQSTWLAINRWVVFWFMPPHIPLWFPQGSPQGGGNQPIQLDFIEISLKWQISVYRWFLWNYIEMLKMATKASTPWWGKSVVWHTWPDLSELPLDGMKGFNK